MPETRSLPWSAVAALGIITGAFSACDQQQAGNAPGNSTQPPSPGPAIPISEPLFGREALLLSVVRAASAEATGVDDLAAQRQLDGRQFEVRVRFGCEGPSQDKSTSGWTFDPEARRLRVRAEPDLSLEESGLRGLFGEGVEDVEGFWLPRPWLLSPACPRTAALAPAEAEAEAEAVARPSSETRSHLQEEPGPAAPLKVRGARVGIAQIFTAADDRTARRSGRAYESSKELPEGEQPGSQGFNLVLSGRLRARPGGRVIHCLVASAHAPPDCVASADIDRVWIERPDDQTVIAEWRR